MTLSTRPPSGATSWPLIVVEGPEKSGKTATSLMLSRDERIGRMFAFALGDGACDEYADIGPYEVVETDGTFSGLERDLAEAVAVPAPDGQVNAVLLDSGTDLWGNLKGWADQRARQSRAGRAKLKEDPDAEIDTAMNLWNDAKERWARIIQILRKGPVVAVITAQGKEVVKVRNGAPVAGETEYTLDAEKTLLRAVTAHVRTGYPAAPRLMAFRRWGQTLPDSNGRPLTGPNPLAEIVFDVLLGEAPGFGTSTVRQMVQGVPRQDAKQRFLAACNGDRACAQAWWEASPWAALDEWGTVNPDDLAAYLADATADEAPAQDDAPGDDPIGVGDEPHRLDDPLTVPNPDDPNVCDWCLREFSGPRGVAAHQQACTARPFDDEPGNADTEAATS